MDVIVRSAVLFVFIFFVARAMGRKELAQLTSFELILLVVMGDLIQQGATGDDRSVVGAILAVSTFALLTLVLSYTAFRWPRAARMLEGQPVILVRDGQIVEDALRVERLTEEELLEAARQEGVADLRDVRLAILEADGRFSFIK